MNAASAEEFFDAISGRYDREFALTGETSETRLKRTCDAIVGCTRVLDLGVGTGRELTRLQDRGHQVTGIDISPRMLERCARRARPIPLVLGDFWKELPFGEASFDAVIALHGALAHPPLPGPGAEPRATLGRELLRVLRPGGLFVADLPSIAWLKTAAEDPTLVVSGRKFVYRDLRTGREFGGELLTDEEWLQLLVGFDVERNDFGLEIQIVARRQ